MAKAFSRQGVTLSFVMVLLIVLVIGAVVMIATGANPLVAYKSGLQAAVGTPYRFLNMLTNMTVLILTGLACSVAFKSGIWNIGVEGQLYLGGFCAAIAGLTAGLSPIVHLPLMLAVAMIAGAAWAFIPGILRVRRGTNEIVVTLMMNYIAVLLTSYLVNYPFRMASSSWPTTATVQPSAQLPFLYPLSRFNASFFLSLLVVVLVLVLMRKSRIGYEWKMTGLNRRAAFLSGIGTGRAMLIAMIVSGALAGLAGGLEVMGVRHCFMDAFSPGYGMTGLLIALVAENEPLRVVLVAFLFTLLKSAAAGMELATNVPAELSDILQTLIVLFLAAQVGLFRSFQETIEEEKRLGGERKWLMKSSDGSSSAQRFGWPPRSSWRHWVDCSHITPAF